MGNNRVPEVFKALASLRPGAIQQLMLAKQQQQQQHPSNEPELLQRLHACLDGAAIQQALGQHTQQQITQQQSTMRQLAAYHQVFELLLASLTTYRPLLLRVKQAYDEALQDATAAACDNVYLHGKMSLVPHRHAEAVAAARQCAEQTAEAMEAELQEKLSQMQAETQKVEAECQDVEQQLQHIHKHMLQARRELDQLDAFSRRAHKDLLDNSSWHMLAGVTGPADR